MVLEEAVPGGFERFSKAANLPAIMEKDGVISEPEFKYFEKEFAT